MPRAALTLPALLLAVAGGQAPAQPVPSLDLTPIQAAQALRVMQTALDGRRGRAGVPASRPLARRADSCQVVGLRPHILACALAFPTLGQDAPPSASGGERPHAAQRVVRVFDFEEQDNPLTLPEGWVRAQNDPLVPRIRPGFPIWNLAALDFESPAHTGAGSVRSSVDGGSASLRLKPGVLPVLPMAKYIVRVAYRCEGLLDARPRLAVRLLDGRGESIPGSERAALADAVDSQWGDLAVEMPGSFPDAAYMQIDLEVVQPREFRPDRLRGHQVWAEDYGGTAWFDDVVVAQVPQLWLETSATLGVFARPDAPVLRAGLRDMAAQDMTATIRVFDSRRRVVASTAREINTGKVVWDWQPELRELGWYRAVIDLTAGRSLIASETCDFLYLDRPPGAARVYGSGPGFQGLDTQATGRGWKPVGIELNTMPPAEPGELADALRLLGARSTTVPVWTADLTADRLPARVDELRTLLTALRQAWVEPRLSLTVVPHELAAQLLIDGQDILDALAADPASWEPYILDAFDRLGATAARWQLGAAGSDRLFRRPSPAADLAATRGVLAPLVPGVELAVGWRLDLDPAALRQAGADVVRVGLPAWSSTTPIGSILGPWLDPAAPRAEFVLAPSSASRLTEREIAADLARRTAELWARATAGADESAPPRFAVAIADPWRVETGDEPAAHPTVAAAAWRALTDRLDGRAFAADWAVVPGVRCLVFGPPTHDQERGGLIVAWRETAPDAAAVLRATLGAEPVTVYDIFGNGRTVEPTSTGEGTRLEHSVALGPEPVFLEGVNTGLVLFLSGVTLDPALIESATGEHQHAVTLTNPWGVPATGRVVVASPGGYDADTQSRDRTWEITPRSLPFDLAPGESVRLPLAVSFSRAIESGDQPFDFDIELTSDANYGWLRARAQARVGWDAVALDLTYRLPRAGAESITVIEATVTNTGEVALPLEAIAYAPGQPRGRSTIGTLEPGQTVVRRFPFPARALAGERVAVSVFQADGAGRLTKGVTLPERDTTQD